KVALEATTPIWPVVNMLRVPPWPSQGGKQHRAGAYADDRRPHGLFRGGRQGVPGPLGDHTNSLLKTFLIFWRDTTPRLRGTPRRTSITTTDLGSSLSPPTTPAGLWTPRRDAAPGGRARLLRRCGAPPAW